MSLYENLIAYNLGKQAGGPGGGGSVDWNDITNKPFGDVETVILPETELTFEYGQGMFTPLALINGDGEYTVTFAGVEYKCTPEILTGDMFTLGNPKAMGGNDNGQPFTIMTGFIEGSLTGVAVSFVEDSTVKVSIKGVVPVRISAKYVPITESVDLNALGFEGVRTSKTKEMTLADDVRQNFENQLDNASNQGNIKVILDGVLSDQSQSQTTSTLVVPMTIVRRATDVELNGIYFDNLITIKYKNGTLYATARLLTFA